MKLSDLFDTSEIEELNEIDFKLLECEKKAIDQLNFDTDTPTEDDKPKKITQRAPKKDQKHYEGHRNRLKDRILQNDIENLADYELLEAALMYAIPRSDVKPLAKTLLNELKTFKNIFLASQDTLTKVNGVGKYTVCFFKIIHEIYCRFNKLEIQDTIIHCKS